MKKILMLTLIFAYTININAQKVKDIKMKTSEDSLSYAFGISIANNLETQKVANLNPQAIGRSFQDYYNKEAKISVEDANKLIQNYFEKQEAEKHKKLLKKEKNSYQKTRKKRVL